MAGVARSAYLPQRCKISCSENTPLIGNKLINNLVYRYLEELKVIRLASFS